MADIENGSKKVEYEKAIAQGTRTFLRYLEKNSRRGKLNNAVTAIRSGEKISADPTTEREMLAHGALNLEKIWEDFVKSGAAVDGTLITPTSDVKEAIATGAKETHPVETWPVSSDKLRELFEASAFMTFSHIGRWSDAREQEVTLSADGTLTEEAALFQRYKQNLKDLTTEGIPSTRSTPTSHLRSGMGTALLVNWGIFNALPAAFFRKNGREITNQEFETLIPAVKEFVSFLTTVHLQTIITIQRELLHSNIWSTQSPPFFKYLCLKEERGKTYLDIETEGLRKVASQLARSTPLTGQFKYGCLALHAKSGRKNVVIESHEWIAIAVKKYLIPHMSEYAQISNKLSREGV